jgi:transcriptional regulator with XRE-family HTH domain
MTAATAPPDGDPIQNWQRKTSEQLPKIVPRALVEDGSACVEEEDKGDWVAKRTQLIEKIIDCILDIANGMPEGVEDPGVARMLSRAVDLQRAASSDPDGADPDWQVKQAARNLKDAVHLMERRLSRLRLDDPTEAASSVIKVLQNVEAQRVAKLLGVSPKTVSQWRSGKVSAIKKAPGRVVFVAQIVRYLQSTWTPHGILAWFETPRQQLAGKAPLQLIDSENAEEWGKLRELARGSRSQLAG